MPGAGLASAVEVALGLLFHRARVRLCVVATAIVVTPLDSDALDTPFICRADRIRSETCVPEHP